MWKQATEERDYLFVIFIEGKINLFFVKHQKSIKDQHFIVPLVEKASAGGLNFLKTGQPNIEY